MRTHRKPIVWLGGAVHTPPFSEGARNRAGRLLRKVQRGESLPMPYSRPMPGIGERCHELRISDGGVDWRIVYRAEPDAVVVLDVFRKTTQATPRHVAETCQWRIKRYEQQRRKAR